MYTSTSFKMISICVLFNICITSTSVFLKLPPIFPRPTSMMEHRSNKIPMNTRTYIKKLIQLKKWAEDLNKHFFPKKTYRWPKGS